MTGGIAYVLRAEADDVLHREFVQLAELVPAEENWVRRVLKEHVRLTGSPRASRILSRRGALPMVRVQPVHFRGTLEATWSPLLAKLGSPAPVALAVAEQPAVSQAIHA
jgi:glutamate synthase domain-containing protein 3